MASLPGRRPPLLLELDLTTAPVEVEPDDLIGKLRSRHRPRLKAVLRTLYEAGDDARVGGSGRQGRHRRCPGRPCRRSAPACSRFAASGKPTVAWAETFGEEGNGTPAYVLATGCREIWLQPSGEVGLQGVAAETTFLRGALDKIGVEPQLDKRYEYKSAADRIMRHEFTPEGREAIDRVVESLWEHAVATIAPARDLDEDTSVRADVALAAGRRRRAGGRAGRPARLPRRGVRRTCEQRAGDDVELLFADQWTPHRTPLQAIRRSKDFVALVEGHGEIVVGRSKQGPRGAAAGQRHRELGAARRARGRARQGRAVPRRLARRLGRRVGHDLARGRADPQGRQADRRVDGHARRFRRLLRQLRRPT